MKFIGFVGALAFAGMVASTAAQATTPVQTFDTDVTRSDTQQAGAWYTDRSAPDSFVGGQNYGGRDGTLAVGVDGADFQGPTSFPDVRNFYDTQGRKFDLAAGVSTANIDLFIDEAFAAGSENRRIAGFWGSTFGGPTDPAYPIIELDRIEGNLVFRGWDNGGSFFDLGVLGAAQVGTWQRLSFSLVGDKIVYNAGGFTGSTSSFGTTSIGNVILQAHNAGTDYSVHWDNLTAGVPEPATWAMMIAGFGLTGATLRRRQRKLATA
jgi:hypothetical protein